jgi:hypothetical protein
LIATAIRIAEAPFAAISRIRSSSSRVQFRMLGRAFQLVWRFVRCRLCWIKRVQFHVDLSDLSVYRIAPDRGAVFTTHLSDQSCFSGEEFSKRFVRHEGYFVGPTELPGDPRPEPGVPIGLPFAACPTPTPGELTVPLPAEAG